LHKASRNIKKILNLEKQHFRLRYGRYACIKIFLLWPLPVLAKLLAQGGFELAFFFGGTAAMGKLLFDETTYQSLPQTKKPLFLFQWLQRLPEIIRQSDKVTLYPFK